MIFLLGSLGDTLVALPALRLVARRFPTAERRVLCNLTLSEKAVSMAALLEGTDLVHGYFWFPSRTRDRNRLAPMLALAREIRRWQPDRLIYMHEQRGRRIALRDAAAFRLLGIPRSRQVGVPLSRELQRRVYHERTGRFEHRAEYLARSLTSLGDPRLSDPSSWDLDLSAAEDARARAELRSLGHAPGILAMSIGSKVDAKDWGDDNWRALLGILGNRLPTWGLLALGAAVERERSEAMLNGWRGPTLNLCGSLSPRQSGAALKHARAFVGHDSGPMHLAAAVGTPCTAIFSARELPGLWFPHGDMHTVFFEMTDCAGCRLDVCVEQHKKCIMAIKAPAVADAVMAMVMGGRAPSLNASGG